MASASELPPDQAARLLSGGQDALPPRSIRTGRRRAPIWLTIILLALTCLGLLASTLTLWAEATVLNTDRFVPVAAPLASNPQAIDGVSRYVADGVVAALDIPGRTASVLPMNGQLLEGPLQQSVHDFVQSHTGALLSSAQMRPIWQNLIRSLHAQTVAALRGQASSVTITNNTLTVDLLPLIAATLRHLQQANPGLIPSQMTIPDLTGTQSPQQQRAALAQALGVQLAPDFGVVTLMHSDALTTAQRIVTTLDRLRVVLPLVTLLLAVIAIWTAADRRRAVILLGIGIAGVFLVAMLLAAHLLGAIESSVAASPAHVIAVDLLNLARASLMGVLMGVAIAGALVALAAYLAGQFEWLARLLPEGAGADETGPAGPPIPAS